MKKSWGQSGGACQVQCILSFGDVIWFALSIMHSELNLTLGICYWVAATIQTSNEATEDRAMMKF